MDANRYFTAMHNAMSSRLPGAQLLAAVRLQDLCGNDAYLEVRRMPGDHCATVCYSTMGRRGLNFQLFRKGWMPCHNESGQLPGQFPAKAESLLEDTDFHACCREDRLDAARTDRMVQELGSTETMKNDFIANVSHELKTPMTTIAGYTDGILDGTIPPEKERQYLQIISDESRRLSRPRPKCRRASTARISRIYFFSFIRFFKCSIFPLQSVSCLPIHGWMRRHDNVSFQGQRTGNPF